MEVTDDISEKHGTVKRNLAQKELSVNPKVNKKESKMALEKQGQ